MCISGFKFDFEVFIQIKSLHILIDMSINRVIVVLKQCLKYILYDHFVIFTHDWDNVYWFYQTLKSA